MPVDETFLLPLPPLICGEGSLIVSSYSADIANPIINPGSAVSVSCL